MERIMRQSEKKSERIPILFKTFLVACGITIVALFGLAFLLYRFRVSESVVSIGIIIIYVLTTFLTGRFIGGEMVKRKFLWGLVSGFVYFSVLVMISVLVHPSEIQVDNHMVTTMILCLASGTLGGMIA